ncbi:histone deacetylase family protein [Ochrovirga pacifica]|uniref:histone deacetylase family protein n=1 Tax=Ochrovirga pacifica TaxID=1042376 RepID=UPI0002558770|nr:histone deacetylase [Ochrovirga pacifica]
MLKIAYHPCYEHPLKKGHRFPMEKYDLIPKQLMYEGTCDFENFFKPLKANFCDLIEAHTEAYVNRLLNLQLTKEEIRQSGFPLSKQIVDRELIITQGTIDCSYYALEYGIAMNVAGGTHHAYSNRPDPFCYLNDQAVGATYLLKNRLAKKVLIVDLDVHQGNGTAEIFRNTPEVFTFSMHGKHNYPFEKEISDLDIGLENNCTDDEYLSTLKQVLPKLLKEQQPDFVFYQSGVDILASDKLGKLACSIEGCKDRDQFVLETFFELNIPVVCCMGGGYSKELRTIVEAHCNTFRIANELVN